ncbi:NAD-dependent epimerase/dehydratase family protein [Arthrobacter sp. Leaf137]|uniref:NAD-dependent epimerase/dehydratase family protein n=1 Tax=Arthrobacter sp. Leaf137 TaxID=1736271 RepID=UPI0006F70D14|nr:NAD-dependent epimerase/dehydratase family protein [Arthrobacter sp. Leaf137]KQQ90765.1 UDP-glucose 4-epimerase [Arthrobacter sp. Leaf137]
MKVVITGAAGFIGSNLASTLLKRGDVDVVGIDSLTDYYPVDNKLRNLDGLQDDRFDFVDADLATVDLGPILEGASAIFHQAGQPGVRKSWGDEFAVYTTQNVLVTQRLLEAARNLDSLEAFVYASSSSVYGDAESYPTSESDRPMPMSPYGVTKLAAEHLATLYAKNFGLPTVSLRYFTVYGPGQRPDMAFNKFLRAAINDQPIPVYGDGTQIREFTHVADIVEANIRAWKRRPQPGSVINLSGGSSVTVNEVLETIAGITGKTLNVQRLEKVAGDVFRTGGSTLLASDLLGWKPSIDIETGLRSEYEWLLGLETAERQSTNV